MAAPQLVPLSDHLSRDADVPVSLCKDLISPRTARELVKPDQDACTLAFFRCEEHGLPDEESSVVWGVVDSDSDEIPRTRVSACLMGPAQCCHFKLIGYLFATEDPLHTIIMGDWVLIDGHFIYNHPLFIENGIDPRGNSRAEVHPEPPTPTPREAYRRMRAISVDYLITQYPHQGDQVCAFYLCRRHISRWGVYLEVDTDMDYIPLPARCRKGKDDCEWTLVAYGFIHTTRVGTVYEPDAEIITSEAFQNRLIDDFPEQPHEWYQKGEPRKTMVKSAHKC